MTNPNLAFPVVRRNEAGRSALMRHWLIVAVGIAALIQGCASRPGHVTVPSIPTGVARWALSPEQQAVADANCYGGMPLNRAKDTGPTELIVRAGYVLEHSDADKVPLWVCESISADQLAGHLRRNSRFRADPDVHGPKAYPEDYRASGYDRGHQAPAGNQTVDSNRKDETFYMSNMAPQRPTLNRGIWKSLEEKTRRWAIRYGHAYEWTGPIRCGADLIATLSRQTRCERKTIGKDGVAVPIAFYKIVVTQDNTTWKVIAFIIPNADYKQPFHLEQYITSVREVERQTGLEFMPMLPGRDRRALEMSVAGMWP